MLELIVRLQDLQRSTPVQHPAFDNIPSQNIEPTKIKPDRTPREPNSLGQRAVMSSPYSMDQRKRLDDTVRSVLGIDRDDEITIVPEFVFDFVGKGLILCPEDTYYLLEAAEQDDPTKGGHGYGIITCMEDACWNDILLSADMNLEDGGRSTGLGSFNNYMMHCQELPHVEARTKRVEKEKAARRRAEHNKPAKKSSLTALGPRPSMAQIEHAASQSQVKDEDVELFIPDMDQVGHGRYESGVSDTEVEELPSIFSGKGKKRERSSQPIVLLSSDEEKPDLSRAGSSLSIKKKRLASSNSLGSQPSLPILIPDSDEDVKPDVKLDVKPGLKSFRSGKAKQTTLDRYQPQSVKRDEDEDRKPNGRMPGAWSSSPEMAPDLDLALPPLPPPGPLGTQMAAHLALEALHAECSVLWRQDIWRHDICSETRDSMRLHRQNEITEMTVNALDKNHFDLVWVTYPTRELCALVPALHGIWQGVSRRQDANVAAVKAPYWADPQFPHIPQAGPSRQSDKELGVGRPWTRASDDEFVGPLEPELREDQLQRFFEDSLKEFGENPNVAEAAEKLGLSAMDEKLPSMKVTLMPHQVVGVAWMLSMERHANRKGGILADSMGLGKTIQTIATMAENPSTDPKRKTTLVIAPVALLAQWEEEIKKFVKPKWRIHVYHGKDNKISLNQLKQFDVVITSYGQVASADPDGKVGVKRGKGKAKANPDNEFIDELASSGEDRRSKQTGDLLKIPWYRVVCDEAMQLRNAKTKTAQAVFKLKSHYRWVLSGTLVVNTLTDLYSQFYFLGISDLSIWDNFKKKIKKLEKRRPKIATQRVQAVLKYACLRRTVKTEIDGKPILNLPEKTIVKRVEAFDEDELAVYNTIEARAKARFNKYLKANTVLKNYAHVLTMILRLRQICDSVSLIVRKKGEPGHHDDLLISNDDLVFDANVVGAPDWDKQAEIDRARAFGGDELVNKLIVKYEERQLQLEAADKKETEEEEAEELDEVDIECAVCFDPFGDDERVTACCHSFCMTCIQGIIKPGLPNVNAVLCPMCRDPIDSSKVFIAAAFKPAEEQVEAEEELDLKVENMDFDEKIPPSTKMRTSLELINGWGAADPNDKILIFSQFVAFINALSDYLEENGITNATYTGGMSKDERDETIEAFKKPNGPRVLIISTKAGGVGLNLVCANKVLLIDHGWTYAATAQSIDRAWRIGQTKPVEVIELSVRNTIEARILELQERKKALADGAFGEGGVGKLGRLTLNDLKRLFERDEE